MNLKYLKNLYNVIKDWKNREFNSDRILKVCQHVREMYQLIKRTLEYIKNQTIYPQVPFLDYWVDNVKEFESHNFSLNLSLNATKLMSRKWIVLNLKDNRIGWKI